MMYNPYYWQWFKLPDIDLNPPTLYSLLESIVNYGKDDKQKIKDLAKYGRSEIFDFDYTLTDRLSKEEFESHIINHYLMRRINFETLTAFKIALNCKINECVPLFNKLYDSILDWDLFVGEEILRVGNDVSESKGSNNTQTISNMEANTESEYISDKRSSDAPQSHLEDIVDGSYVTNYSRDNDNTKSKDTSKQNGDSKSTNIINDKKEYNEKITHTPNASEKLEIIKNIQNEISNIYQILYKELDNLFYGIL